MDNFLALIVKTEDGFSGKIAELMVIAVDKTREDVEKHLSEGLALYLEDVPNAKPIAQTFDALPEETKKSYEGVDVQIAFVKPAAMNPLSLKIGEEIEKSGLSYRELGKKMGTSHSALHRMADPFYWGHSVATLRKLAEVLGMEIEVRFKAA